MKNWFGQAGNFITRIFPSERVSYRYKFTKEEAEEVEEGIIYVVGERPYYWMACFKCPCGCGQAIQLNILRKSRPNWRFIVRWRKLSLYPSIWREVGCRSHFYIRKGKVLWCNNNENNL